jgi:hypothetical protein
MKYFILENSCKFEGLFKFKKKTGEREDVIEGRPFDPSLGVQVPNG